MAFKDTLSSEETFPLSLVQNYYFSNFPSEVLGGLYISNFVSGDFVSKQLSMQISWDHLAPSSCMTGHFYCYVSLPSYNSTILDEAVLANG